MSTPAKYRAGFPGLVDFAQRSNPDLADRFRSPRPNANDATSALPPAWLRDDNTAPLVLRQGTELVFEEDGIEPEDLHGSNGSVATEVLAYYLPYHFYKLRTWGIYLRAAGIGWLARQLKERPLTPGPDEYITLARSMLHAHELYHCTAETAVTRAELVAAQPAYAKYFADSAANPDEEGLANAFAFDKFRRRWPTGADGVRRFMLSQPPGYRDFERWLGVTADQRRVVQAQHVLRVMPSSTLVRPPASGEYLVAHAPAARVPVRVVIERGSGIDILRPFPPDNGMQVAVHTRDHPPPHIHIDMPVGRPRGSFEWPSLRPIRATLPLSRAEQGRVDQYISSYGQQIEKKVRSVYPSA